MTNILNELIKFFESLFILILLVGFLFLNSLLRRSSRQTWKETRTELKQKRETLQSLEELAYDHSRYYPYIREMIPETIRLHLSKYRGDRKALSWRIKLLKMQGIIDPHAAQMLMEEYMITEGRSSHPVSTNNWTCPKCGTHNQETALFCKNCGEYK